MKEGIFEQEYKKLNKAQREAVETIEGPVMVVAGPGTGKTQILALRIANILKKTDYGSSSILCLTFTNSAVRAMRERLQKYIGAEAGRVEVFTFHKFAGEIIEEFYPILGFDVAPKVMEDAESVSVCDSILHENEWEYLRPRGDIGRHFKELKSLISLLKRERLSPEKFLQEIKKEIKKIKEDPESLSTRGESKGKMKKEFANKIESLNRTVEIVRFYELYEAKKREKDLMDHDDTINYALQIVENSEEARANLREKYLYVLVDEHQDSSGAQNALLKAIWQKEEKPNIFAVGDDRQLIYAFGGANISHFEEFKTAFGKAKVIFLTDNYRSTQKILNTAEFLLSSSFSKEKLVATLTENHDTKLVECDYPRDEIIACGLELQEKLKDKKLNLDINNCAILVPKNRQVVSAIRVLRDMGIKVASAQALALFETQEFKTILRILKICINADDSVSLSALLLDPVAEIPVLLAHKYLYEKQGKNLSLSSVLAEKKNLPGEEEKIKILAEKLKGFVEQAAKMDVYGLVQLIGEEILIKSAKNHEELVQRIEVIRTFLHLALSFSEKGQKSLADFVVFLERLQEYDEDIPLAVFGGDEGIKVLTLHGSKGLEFDFVWIAHLDEKSLMKGKRRNFVLPESIAEKIEEKDELAAKRELYVAITRAKRFCTLSHSRLSYSGQVLELAKIISALPNSVFSKSSFSETEKKILSNDLKVFVVKKEEKKETTHLKKLTELVKKEYLDRHVSVSLLNNFFECPWKWYFRNLLELPEAKSESLEFGSSVHTAVEKILKLKKIPEQEKLEEITKGDKEVLKIVSRWVKNRLGEIEKKRESEKSISLHAKEFPHLNIYGKLDLVEFIDAKNIRVTDFKTGGAKKKSEIEKTNKDGKMSNYLRQLAMYSFLVERNPKWKKEVSESRLEFLEAKKEKESIYNTFIKKAQIDLLVADIKDYDESIKRGDWFFHPCNFNSYGKSIECEYCKMAKIYD